MHGESEVLTMMIAVPTVFGVTAWCFRLFLNFLQQRRMSRQFFELQNKVLDKYGSSEEALQYLESDAGRRFLETASVQAPDARAKVLGAVQSGTVVTALGIGFLLIRSIFDAGFQAFTIIGTLGLCLGIGYLLSAVVAYYLSRNWGVFNDNSRSDES